MQEINNTPIKPDSGLVWGILTTMFCCLPFGVVSIIKAVQVDNMWALGHYEQANEAAKSAKRWALIAAICPIAVIIIYLLVIAVAAGIAGGIAVGTSQLLDL